MKRTDDNAIVNGPIGKQLMLFFLPVWLGLLFQQLYNTVDTLVVGQFVGTGAVAAVHAEYIFIGLGCVAVIIAALLIISSKKHPELGLDN